jgi:Domain of unknown function (DUF6484)
MGTARSLRRKDAVGVTRGMLVGFNDDGEPLVDFPRNGLPSPTPAISTVQLRRDHAGTEVVLIFEDGDRSRPIILGVVQAPLAKEQPGMEVAIDRKTIDLNAEDEIVLRCGKSSITLTRAGKVLIRGAYVLTRSSGVNRIKGGSVQIN